MSDEPLPFRVYRVQDREGRGPFRPGFSRYWFEDRDDYPLSWIEEFGYERVMREIRSGESIACGCRSLDQLARWFRPSELATLRDFGYDVVSIDADRIIDESLSQVVFARRRPLRFGALLIAA
jgi:hypothetical protein